MAVSITVVGGLVSHKRYQQTVKVELL